MFKKLLLFLLLFPSICLAQGMNGLITGVAPNLSTGLTRYAALQNSATAWNTTETIVQQVMPISGTLSKLRVCLSGTSGTGSRVFTVRKNTADTGITTTITNATCNQDLSNTLSVVPGDIISLKQVTSGTVNSVTIRWSIQIQATTNNTYPLLMTSVNQVAAGQTKYYNPQGADLGQFTEQFGHAVMPTDGTIEAMYIQTDIAVTATDLAFMVRKNNADTALTLTLTAGQSTGSVAASVSYSAGDIISIRAVKTGGNSPRFAAGLHFAPTADGESIAMSTSISNMNQASTFYSPAMGGLVGLSATESPVGQLFQAGVMTKMRGRSFGNVGGSGQTLVTTTRLNTAASALTCTINTGANSCTISSNVSVLDDDVVNYEFVSSATAGTTAPYGSIVFMLPTNTPTSTPTMTPTNTPVPAILNSNASYRRARRRGF